jgi:acetyl esterase/lipase
MTLPFGYLVPVVVIALCTAVALVGPRPARTTPSHWSWWLTFVINEQPFLAFFWLFLLTAETFVAGDLTSPGGEIGVATAVLTAAGLAVLVRRALRAGPVLDRALADELGVTPPARRRRPVSRILLPFLVRRGDVARVKDLPYGDAGKRNLLDVYHHRGRPAGGGPTLIFLHGGGFRSGHKNREGRAMLNRLASEGWVCVSANYRLGPEARFPDPLVDVKKVIAWVRAHVGEYGGDPGTVFVAGSSAGAHLAAMAGLTANDPGFQPGFTAADTSVSGVICFYAYLGRLGGPQDAVSSPADRLHPDAPPFLVIHGDQDSSTLVEDTREFVTSLRAVSRRPVVYAELPGAQHTFDLLHSIRYTQVITAVSSFAAAVARPGAGSPSAAGQSIPARTSLDETGRSGDHEHPGGEPGGEAGREPWRRDACGGRRRSSPV